MTDRGVRLTRSRLRAWHAVVAVTGTLAGLGLFALAVMLSVVTSRYHPDLFSVAALGGGVGALVFTGVTVGRRALRTFRRTPGSPVPSPATSWWAVPDGPALHGPGVPTTYAAAPRGRIRRVAVSVALGGTLVAMVPPAWLGVEIVISGVGVPRPYGYATIVAVAVLLVVRRALRR